MHAPIVNNNITVLFQANSVELVNDSVTTATNISKSILVRNCSQHFSTNDETGFCFPVCGEWEEFTHNQVTAFATLTTFLSLLHFIGAIIAIAFSLYNYQIMRVDLLLQTLKMNSN